MPLVSRRWRPGAVAFAVVAAMAAVSLTAPPAAAVSGGPVIDQHFADPDVMRVGGTYYAYATNSDGRNIKWATSTDLVNWSVQGSDALPTLGAWVDPTFSFPSGGPGDHGIWAPEVFDTGNGFTMWYTAHDRASNRQCIGAARASDPGGPFVPQDTSIVCTPHLGGSIDPSSFVENGQRYMLWKNDGNCCSQDTWLRIVPVSGDGLALTGNETLLIKQDRPNEGALVEAPTLWKRGGTYVLFFSAAHFGDDTYNTSYARSGSLLGPYTKADAPLLTTGAFSGTVRGPGGQDIVTGPDGKDKIVFHGWNSGYNYRAMYVADLGWANDYPVARGAKVNYEAEHAALTHVNNRSANGAGNGRAVGGIDFADSRVEFSVFAPRGGTYRLSVRFGNGSGATATHNLSVNGAGAGTVVYGNTGWDNWQTAERTVDLDEGFNTIAFTKGDWWTELDRIEID